MAGPQRLPAVAATLEAWHRLVACSDLSGLPALLHPDAIFHSPMAFKETPGRPGFP